MIAGETRTISYVDTRTAEFTYAPAPTVDVVQPDGTSMAPAPTVSVDSADLALSHTVWFKALFPVVGEYLVNWHLEDPDNVLLPSQRLWVAWTDIWSLTRDILTRSIATVPDIKIDAWATALWREWRGYWGDLLPSYELLTGYDQRWADMALAYTIAATMRPMLPKDAKSVAGELTRVKQNTVEYSFTLTTKVSSKTIEELWLDTAWLFLQQISTIGVEVKKRLAARHLFAVAGPRRKAEEANYPSVLTNPLYQWASARSFVDVATG